MEEIYLEGPLGNTDIRVINSYPSKVGIAPRTEKVPKSLPEESSKVLSQSRPRVTGSIQA